MFSSEYCNIFLKKASLENTFERLYQSFTEEQKHQMHIQNPGKHLKRDFMLLIANNTCKKPILDAFLGFECAPEQDIE